MMANQAESIHSSEGKASTQDTYRRFQIHFEKNFKDMFTSEEVKQIEELVKNKDHTLQAAFKEYTATDDMNKLKESMKKLLKPAVFDNINVKQVPIISQSQNYGEFDALRSPEGRGGNFKMITQSTPIDHENDQSSPEKLNLIRHKTENGSSINYQSMTILNPDTYTMKENLEKYPSQGSVPEKEKKSKSFKQLLVSFVLQNQGMSERIVESFVDYMESKDHETMTRDLVDYTKSRLVQVLKEDIGIKDIGIILRNGDIFMETFEHTNRVKGDQFSYLKTELTHKLNSLDIDEKQKLYGSLNADDDNGWNSSPNNSARNISSNNSSGEKKGNKSSLKSKKGTQYQGLKLQTVLGDKHSPEQLKRQKSKNSESEHHPKPNRLVKKNTMLIENNQLENDDLETIGCNQVDHIKKLNLILERILQIALISKDITESEVSNLKRLLNMVTFYNKEPHPSPNHHLQVPKRPPV